LTPAAPSPLASPPTYTCPKCGRTDSRRSVLLRRWDGGGNLRVVWEYSCNPLIRDGRILGWSYIHSTEEVMPRRDGLVFSEGRQL
jgi:hypothetical protein